MAGERLAVIWWWPRDGGQGEHRYHGPHCSFAWWPAWLQLALPAIHVEFLIVSPITGLDMGDFMKWCEDSELSEETTKLLKDNGFSSVTAVKLLKLPKALLEQQTVPTKDPGVPAAGSEASPAIQDGLHHASTSHDLDEALKKGLDATSLLQLLGQPVAAPEDSAKGKIHAVDPSELDQPRLPSICMMSGTMSLCCLSLLVRHQWRWGKSNSPSPALNPRWKTSPPSSTWRPASESYGQWPRMGSRQEHFCNMSATS